MERLVLFAKAPRLHGVKTRLAPRLNAEQSLLLYEAMLHDQIVFSRGLRGPERSIELCLDRHFSPPLKLAAAMADVSRTLQGEGDLGARMDRALARAFADGAARAGILGADAPTVPRGLVEEAFAALRGGADAAIVPALDGGYVFIGASRPVPALFDGVPWGTPEVVETTRRLAAAHRLALAETAPWPDVDAEDDLPRLMDDLTADPSRAPATLAVASRLGLYASQNPMV